MKYNKLGTTNLKVSEIGLGTMTFGEQCTKKVSLNIMDAAYEKGVNFFDTRNCIQFIQKKKHKENLRNILVIGLKIRI